MSPIATLASVFGQLSILAVGGTIPVLPELQRQIVDVHHFMNHTDFAALFALAQAAPGPNMMVATLIGWRVAGPAGALVATGSLIGPSSLLTYVTVHVWQRFRDRPWRRIIQSGLTPVTMGLLAAGAALLAFVTTTGVVTGLITLVTVIVLLRSRVHPLWMLGLGAVLGAVFG